MDNKQLITQAELLRATNCGLPRLKRLEYSGIITADKSSTGNRRLFDAAYIDVIKALSNKKPRMTAKQLELRSRSDYDKLQAALIDLSDKMKSKLAVQQSKIEQLEMARTLDQWAMEDLTQKVETQSQIINALPKPETLTQLTNSTTIYGPASRPTPDNLTITIPPTDLAEIEKAIITLKHAKDEAKRLQDLADKEAALTLKKQASATVPPKQPKLTKAQEEQERRKRRGIKQRAIQADYKRMCEEYHPTTADFNYVDKFVQVTKLPTSDPKYYTHVYWEGTPTTVLEALDACKANLLRMGKIELKDPTAYDEVLAYTKTLTPPNPESDVFLPQWETDTPYVSRFATTESITPNEVSEGTYISSVEVNDVTSFEAAKQIASQAVFEDYIDSVIDQSPTDAISEWGDIVDESTPTSYAPNSQAPNQEYIFPKLWQEQLKSGTLINHPNPPDIDFSYLDLEFDDPEYNVGALKAKVYQELWNRFRTLNGV